MKDVNILINNITENIMELTGFERSLDIKSILYMNLSGVTLQEESTELTSGRDNLADAVDNWLIEFQLEGCTEGSIRAYAGNLKNFLAFVNKGLPDIKERDIKNYLAHGKIKRKWKDTTYNTQLRAIRSFFKYCYEYDLIPEDPCKRIRDTRMARVMQPILTAEQRELVRCACKNERELAMVDLLYSSGMRVSEVVKMNRRDVDLYGRRARCHGKGRKDREIMFSAECGVHLKRYLESREDSGEALFVGLRSPYKRLSKNGIEVMLRSIRDRDPRLKGVSVTPHVFRRTRGTDLINRGMPAELVAQKFGHENVQTLLDCYAAISKNTVWAAEEKCG